jgi:hypothetical protein
MKATERWIRRGRIKFERKMRWKKRTRCRSETSCVRRPLTMLEDISPLHQSSVFISKGQAEPAWMKQWKKSGEGYSLPSNHGENAILSYSGGMVILLPLNVINLHKGNSSLTDIGGVWVLRKREMEWPDNNRGKNLYAVFIHFDGVYDSVSLWYQDHHPIFQIKVHQKTKLTPGFASNLVVFTVSWQIVKVPWKKRDQRDLMLTLNILMTSAMSEDPRFSKLYIIGVPVPGVPLLDPKVL